MRVKDRSHSGSRASVQRCLTCEAPSYLGAAEGICILVRHFLMQIRMPQQVFATELVLRECLNNAIVHGNRSDSEKRVKVSIVTGVKGIRLRVADEGNGFCWKRQLVNSQREQLGDDGRGLALIQAYARRVGFNTKGNVITVDMEHRSSEKGRGE